MVKLQVCFIVSSLIGGNDSNLTSIFFRWVETTEHGMNLWHELAT